MCWDANLIRTENDWLIRRFSGTNWQSVNDQDKLKYVVNSYRVLLTRHARGWQFLFQKVHKMTQLGTLNGMIVLRDF